jgi:DNA-binding response OmpR family regulator
MIAIHRARLYALASLKRWAYDPLISKAGGDVNGVNTSGYNAAFPPSSKRILVVDDDPALSRAMELLLSRAGFRPIVCGTAQEAIAHAADANIAVAVVDIHLPDMNGLALTQQLRTRLGPKTPIVVLSGDRSMETIRALEDTSATYFFAKPVNAVHLIEQVKRWTSGASETNAVAAHFC